MADRGQIWGAYWSKAILSPRTGRIWMTMQDRIYILSNWASPNISAWSVYIPEFTINNADVVFADPYVVLRATDGRIFRFGSQGRFDLRQLPCHRDDAFSQLRQARDFQVLPGLRRDLLQRSGLGLERAGELRPDCHADALRPDLHDRRARRSWTGAFRSVAAAPTFSFKITHQAPGPATLSKVFLHYATSDTS